jgi:hypothetical protein
VSRKPAVSAFKSIYILWITRCGYLNMRADFNSRMKKSCLTKMQMNMGMKLFSKQKALND